MGSKRPPIYELETHTYYLDGHRYPSVSEILAPIKTGYDSNNPAAGELGTDVHLATEYDDIGVLDPRTVDDTVAPYLESWRWLKQQAGIRVSRHYIEYRFVNDREGYAGTFDRMVEIGSDYAILDLKSGAPQDWHAVQTFAYRVALQEECERGRTPTKWSIARPAFSRYTAYLRGDGSAPRLVRHTRPADAAAWSGCQLIHHWRTQKK